MLRLFISDLHLSEETPEIEQAFYEFLRRESKAESLIILGDLFEVWVGDDDDAAQPCRVKEKLLSLSRAGWEVLLLPGNRDFMLGHCFAQEVGGKLLEEESVVEVCGLPTLLMHGDTLCTDDVEYQNFREMVHSPDWKTEAMKKSLMQRRSLARQIRQLSNNSTSNKPENIMDVNETTVLTKLEQMRAQRLIHGHTHRPMRHKLDGRERIVLGDWTSRQGWLLREQGETLTLERFPIP